jgi:acyl carrier protein
MNDILPRVKEAFRETFGVEAASITLETTPADIPAWDSVGHLTLASNMERIFGMTFDVDEMMEMENVRAIFRILEAKLNRS